MALILIAEDAPDIVELLTTILQARGHQVAAVTDGIQLVEKTKTWRPHLIISDVMMPGAYGSAAYKSLLEDPVTARTPIVFITAAPEDKVRRIIPDSPQVRLLLKPLDLQKLVAAVTELLATSSA